MQARIKNISQNPEMGELIEVDTFDSTITMRGNNLTNHDFVLQIARCLEQHPKDKILETLRKSLQF